MPGEPIEAVNQVTPLRKSVAFPFENCILSILDSHDKFGLWARKSKADKLKKHFLLDSEAFKGMDTLCGGDSTPIRRQAMIFFQGVAMALEIRTGARICSIVELDDEGLGRAVVYSGRLVLTAYGWRQGQFGFTSMDAVIEEGERFIAAGLEWLEKYPEIAGME
jgi:probable nitrogen fixation protein